MKSFILLLLSLMTGCEASSEVKACPQGWVEFFFKYPETDKRNQSVDILRVATQQLEHEDFRECKCKFDQDSDSSDDVDDDDFHPVNDCKKPFAHTAYRAAKTTITCDVQRKKDKAIVKFFCKESGSICEVVLSTRSSLRSNGTFTLTETNSGFNISITNVSPQHAGVYWCGVESNERRYRAALKKIQLQVEDISNSTKSLTTGQTFTYQCVYPNNVSIKKILCKGEDPSICEPLANSLQREKKIKRFSIEDNKKGEITITMRQLTTEDSGTYWCGAQITDKPKSNPFFHKLVMTVGGSWLSVIIPVVVCVALLMLILVSVYKRFQRTKNTRKAEAQNNKVSLICGFHQLECMMVLKLSIYSESARPTKAYLWRPCFFFRLVHRPQLECKNCSQLRGDVIPTSDFRPPSTKRTQHNYLNGTNWKEHYIAAHEK